MTKYAGVLSALLVTALLFWLTPGLLKGRLSDSGRTDESLKPPVSRTMVVWVTSWQPEDRSLISGLCSAFEKQQPGLRVYLRRVDAEELYAEGAVLPDVVLHGVGEIRSPGDALLPLSLPSGYPENVASAGASQGVQYALPLWYSPNVLCLPAAWAAGEDGIASEADIAGEAHDAGTQNEAAYFALETPAPEVEAQPVTIDSLPWAKMMESGQVYADSGVGLAQLLLLCPGTLRQDLSRCTPQIGLPPEEGAVVRSLQSHLSGGGNQLALVPPTVASQRVRYVSLCRDSEAGADFIRFLLGDEAGQQALSAQLIPVSGAGECGEGLLRQTMEAAKSSLLLPNAFGMGIEELEALCLQDFASAVDPVATLLKLR